MCINMFGPSKLKYKDKKGKIKRNKCEKDDKKQVHDPAFSVKQQQHQYERGKHERACSLTCVTYKRQNEPIVLVVHDGGISPL